MTLKQTIKNVEIRGRRFLREMRVRRKKRAATEDLLEGEDMLTCDVCCRCVRLIFTVEGLKACLEIIRRREELRYSKLERIPSRRLVSNRGHGRRRRKKKFPSLRLVELR